MPKYCYTHEEFIELMKEHPKFNDEDVDNILSTKNGKTFTVVTKKDSNKKTRLGGDVK